MTESSMIKSRVASNNRSILQYDQICNARSSMAAQFGFNEKEVEDIIFEQLINLMKRQYQEQYPDTDPDIGIDHNTETKNLEFYIIANGQKKHLSFEPRRRESSEFLNLVIAGLDNIRATREYEVFMKKRGTAIKGTIERIELAGYVVDLGKFDKFRARGFLPKNETAATNLERNKLTPGNTIMSYITDIKVSDPRSNMSRRVDDCAPRIMLSRTRTEFMSELLKIHCYEVGDGIIEIKKIARDPGIRTKIAVYSTKPEIDAVGSCIGVHGSRIKPLSDEANERIDIVNWSPDLEKFIKNSLAPLNVTSCAIRYPNTPNERLAAEVVVPEGREQAIGRHGVNARLISALTECKVEILAQPNLDLQLINQMQDELMSNLQESLDIDEDSARMLVSNGFPSTFTILHFGKEELISKLDIEDELATIIVQRAAEAKANEIQHLIQNNIDPKLLDTLEYKHCLYLVYNIIRIGIKTLDDAWDEYNNPKYEESHALLHEVFKPD